MRNRKLGKLGEEEAEKFLKKKGLKSVGKNFHCRWGEIDLVMKDGKTLVFVEVKTRSNASFGTPEEAVNQPKLSKLLKSAYAYLEQNGIETQDFRLDAVAIEIQDQKVVRISHIPNLSVDTF